MIDKAKAIALLTTQAEAGSKMLQVGQGDLSKWRFDTAALFERLFGKDSRQSKGFGDIRWKPMVLSMHGDNSAAFRATEQSGLRRSVAMLQSAVQEVEQFWEADQPAADADPFQRIERICNRFHAVARQLRRRHASRPTLDISDEYDVQDLLHALLSLDFEDVRPEEWAPNYAGASSRMDFLLKREQIVLEAKKTRKGLGAKEVGEQLLVDCQRYQGHPDCKMLVCFVYDPEGLVANPRGLESDLSTAGGELPVRVFIRP